MTTHIYFIQQWRKQLFFLQKTTQVYKSTFKNGFSYLTVYEVLYLQNTKVTNKYDIHTSKPMLNKSLKNIFQVKQKILLQYLNINIINISKEIQIAQLTIL